MLSAKVSVIVRITFALALSSLFVSCVHPPIADEYYFQAMGEPQEIVVTVDTRSPERLPSQFLTQDPSFSQLLARVHRLSVTLYDPDRKESEDGLLDTEDLSRYQFYGAAEGNIPAFLTNSALL